MKIRRRAPKEQIIEKFDILIENSKEKVKILQKKK